ncbi:MAG: hypothetical protein HN842_06585, partial [Gammaproteobacteria bacterium]|nr:hypothetical protein [Gammaproteobacteria bacterium]
QTGAAWAKMPKTQRQALQSYTGNGYGKINQSLWSGNPSGAAKSAAQAMMTHAHDIAPGTILSRKIDASNSLKKELMNSVGKVLQEPAVSSTSIRPTAWSGSVQIKMTVGSGVKGMWVGEGSKGSGGCISVNCSEDEMLLPPNTRMLVQKVNNPSKKDKDGFGGNGMTVIEVLLLPSH